MRGPRSSIRQYAGVLFLVIIRFSLAEKSCGVFAREKWRQRKRGAVGRLAPVNATRNVGRYLCPQKPYVLLLSEGKMHDIKNIKKPNNELYTAQELKELSIDFDVIYQLLEQQETDLTPEQTQALKELVTYYPVTNISVNSDQLDGYTVFNYPISMANGWNYVKQQLNDNRDYIYDMDIQSAEAYVNSEYAVALAELEV